MKNSSFLVVVLMLLSSWVSLAFGQTSDPVSLEKQPRVAAGHPTLKQRPPNSSTPVVNGSRVSQRLAAQEDSADDPHNNQKAIHIAFEGLHAFSEVEMMKAFREQGIGLSKPPLSLSEVVGKGVARIRELLESRGHFQAAVDARYDEGSGTVVFLVDEGQRFGLTEVRFEGNERFSSQELRSTLETYLARFPKMLEGYDSNIFDYCSRDLVNFIRSRGYLHATLGEPIKSIEGGGLVLTIPVKEGVLYRVGEITIDGAKAVAPEIVRSMLNLRQGDVASGEDIGKWLFEDVKKVYGEMGYIEYTAEPDPEFKAPVAGKDEGVVDFRVTIEEGKQFRVHAIKFQGNSLPERDLRVLLRIRSGEVFNQRLFEESIDELNKLGRFQLVDKDRDADFRTDDEEALIDIVIKVKNKDPGLGQAGPGRSLRQSP
jgi:outer membrane protein insertion porin family